MFAESSELFEVDEEQLRLRLEELRSLAEELRELQRSLNPELVVSWPKREWSVEPQRSEVESDEERQGRLDFQ